MNQEKEIKYQIYLKSQEKKQVIKELKELRWQLLQLQGEQHLDKEKVKTLKRNK